MRLRKLILEQFRNYAKLEIDFDSREPMTYIVGPNAQGKTNILESIYLLALTKSFRTTRQQEMIGWEYEYARVKGTFAVDATADDGAKAELRRGAIIEKMGPTCDPQAEGAEAKSLELEAFLGKPPNPQKAFKKNDVKISATNFIGNCQVVFFHPEDLNILYLGPDLRRAYLNVINVQVNRKYFSALRAYQKVLKQRNALLHAIRDERANVDDLDVWDEQLIEHGGYLMHERSKTLAYFQKHLSETYRKISKGDETVRLNYFHTLSSNEAPPDTLETWQSYFTRELANARPRDLQALVTTVGPHRDDLEFSFNGLKLAALASRGEYRSLLLALKLIELKFFEEQSGQKPILLLDDVFSELDPQRQNFLLQAIEGHQTIITATHLNDSTESGRVRKHRSVNSTVRAGQVPPRRGKYLEVSQGTIHE